MATAKNGAKPKPDGEVTLAINGRAYTIDLDDLTVDEIETIEDEFDRQIGDLTKADWKRAKMTRCIVYFLLRRDGQDVTMDDVREIRILDIGATEENGSTARPTKRASRAKPNG